MMEGALHACMGVISPFEGVLPRGGGIRSVSSPLTVPLELPLELALVSREKRNETSFFLAEAAFGGDSEAPRCSPPPPRHAACASCLHAA